MKRIMKEYNDLQKNPPSSFTVTYNPENPHEWTIALFGPDDTPYAKGLFLISLELPEQYPFKPPIWDKVKFLTKIYHPNVEEDGLYDPWSFPNILCSDEWNPAFTIAKVVEQIEKHLKEPSTERLMTKEAAYLYVKDREKFTAKAREWTMKYAQ